MKITPYMQRKLSDLFYEMYHENVKSFSRTFLSHEYCKFYIDFDGSITFDETESSTRISHTSLHKLVSEYMDIESEQDDLGTAYFEMLSKELDKQSNRLKKRISKINEKKSIQA